MTIFGLRNESEVPENLRGYKIKDLVDSVDCVLSEHGFSNQVQHQESSHNVRLYEGIEGWIRVIFVSNENRVILMSSSQKEARCPIYIHLHQVPENVMEEIKTGLWMI